MTVLRWKNFLEPQIVVFSVCAVFYLYVLAILLTAKQRLARSSYFTIFIYTGVVDIIFFLGDQYYRAANRLGTGPELNIPFVIASQITGINFSLHVFGNFLQTLCQYTVVVWPHSYEKLWSFRKTLAYLLLLTLATNAAYFGGWWMKNKYTKQKDGSYSAETIDDSQTLYIFASIQVILYVILAIFLVIRTLLALRKFGATKFVRRHYQSLAVITLLDSSLFCVDLVYEIDMLYYLFFNSEIYPDWLVNFIYKYFDIFYSLIYVSNPIILMICSRIARVELIRPFLRTKSMMTIEQSTKTAARTSKRSSLNRLSSVC